MNFYGQNLEDEWIANNLDLPEHGFYLDIGCGHPFTTSNTAFLRDRKWDGLAIDGFRGWEQEWSDIPAFCCAVIASQKHVKFMEDHNNPYWSKIDESGNQLRAAISIEELLSERGICDIDLLSVDTEGTELDVLMSFDFNLHRPSIVIAEYNAAHLPIVEPDQSPIPAFMATKGYELRKVFGIVNMIFTR